MIENVWRTNSNIRWTFVSGDSVSECLIQLARLLDDFGIEEHVSHLDMAVSDDGTVTIGALTEEPLS